MLLGRGHDGQATSTEGPTAMAMGTCQGSAEPRCLSPWQSMATPSSPIEVLPAGEGPPAPLCPPSEQQSPGKGQGGEAGL